jgi:hypothetical protein
VTTSAPDFPRFRVFHQKAVFKKGEKIFLPIFFYRFLKNGKKFTPL